MTKWLIGILVSSVVMSFVLKILPENSIKRSAHMAFGIIFLMVTATPLLGLFSSGFKVNDIDFLINSKMENITDDADDKYVLSVVDEYSASLVKVAENKILEETGDVCKVDINVCNDIDSSRFGQVLNVRCEVLEKSESENIDENSIVSDIPVIKDIVISFTEKEKKPEPDSSDICDVLVELFGVTKEQCEIYAGGE